MSYRQIYFWTVQDSDNSDAGEKLRATARELNGEVLDETLVGFEEEEPGFKGVIATFRDELSEAGLCWSEDDDIRVESL